MPDKQAEALVELMAQQREDVATKADIATLQSATKADIAALQSNMATKIDLAEVKADIATINDQMATKTDIAEVKTQLLIYMITLGGVIIAAIKLL